MKAISLILMRLTFKVKATEQGVDSFLNNPQTLIMLAKLVKTGQWPNTKKELYECATSLLLTEHNDTHKHHPFAAYKPELLKEAAGAACTVLLISDSEGISLLNSGKNPYSEVPFHDSNIVLATLTKQAFVTINHINEAVSYSHRTIAEYLAACWLVKTARNGLPVSRVMSWIGIDNHPALELRGLFAWLVHLLPEYADALMANDPYGLLILGDISCLCLSSRKVLLNKLVVLAEKGPWFRSQDWTSEPLGALSTPDMANEFKAILAKEPKQFHLRSIVLDAIQYGEPQPELQDELLQLFCDSDAPYAERADAFYGLVNVVPNGISLVVKATKEKLGTHQDDLRLKEEVISKHYEGHFSVIDVVQLIGDYVKYNNRSRHSIGGLWILGRSLPLKDLPAILDRLIEIHLDEYRETLEYWHFNYEALTRILQNNNHFDAHRLWSWMSKLNYSARYNYSSKNDAIKDWFINNQQYVTEFFNIALLEQTDLTNIWNFWNHFQQSVLFTLDINRIIESGFTFIAEKLTCDEKDRFIYDLILNLTICCTTDITQFEKLIDYGNARSELEDIIKRACYSEVQDWRWKDAARKIKNTHKRETTNEKNLRSFEKQKELIQTGQHFGWTAWLANVYFARFDDVDGEKTPSERLQIALGNENTAVALLGFQALLERNDLPTASDVITSYAENKYHPWWFAILAGITERWRLQSNLNSYPENLLKTALALNLLFSPFYEKNGNTINQITPDWQNDIFDQNPALVQSTYLEVIETLLRAKRKYIPGLRDVCEHTSLENQRAKIILDLLTKFPSASAQELEMLVFSALKYPEIRNETIALAKQVLTPHTKIRLKQKAIWVCVGFLLEFENFKEAVSYAARKYDFFLWTFIRVMDNTRTFELSAEQFHSAIRLVGTQFPDTAPPIGGWSGDRHPWDAAEFVKRNINQLSTHIGNDFMQVLNTLIDTPELFSYRDHLKHAAANQGSLLRNWQFTQPSWQQITTALSTGKPANISDLHALTIDHLQDIENKIRTDNTDIFKISWNEDAYGRITNQPKPKESCRNRLVDLLRQKFTPLEINVEPDGHMAIDKRADIVLLDSARRKLPIEIKRDYHPDLWTACENQLDTLYTRDPQAQGYGIYLVF